MDIKIARVEDTQWLTGFWEGDGTVACSLNNYPQIIFSQVEKFPLECVASIIGLEDHLRQYNGIWRIEANGDFRVTQVSSLFKNNLVSPKRVEQLKDKINIDFKENEPTLPWVAGFFDAEGSVYLSPRGSVLELVITQKEGLVLEKIQKFLGLGNIKRKGDSWDLRLIGTKSQVLLPSILKYSRSKIKVAKILESLVILSAVSSLWSPWLNSIKDEYWWTHNILESGESYYEGI